MPAINLKSAAKKAATGALATTNPLEAFGGAGRDIVAAVTPSTVTAKLDAISGISGPLVETGASAAISQISAITGLSAPKVSASLLSGAIGAAIGGSKGAAIGALGGALLGGGGLKSIFGEIQTKLDGIIGNAPELLGITNDALKIIEKGAADLRGVTGEEHGLVIDQYNQQAEKESVYAGTVDKSYVNPHEGVDTSASRVPNPLRNHNGVNYKLTLGILSAEEYNNPELYRSAEGFKNYVIQSSGGNLDKRYQVFDEHAGNVAGNVHQDGSQTHAEYYIDDIDLEAVVAPNPKTRITSGTSLAFTVVEPYSMGNFVQALIGSAFEAGYDSYAQAPFCLKIDFAGWNEDGGMTGVPANFIERPMFIPIQIINMDFKVSGSGSSYNVSAIPMSETGLADNINQTKTSVTATGLFVHEVLETNDLSITGAVNSHIEGLEEAGALAPYDRYIIAFPKDRDTIQNALASKTITETAFTTSPQEQEEQRRGAIGGNSMLNLSYEKKVITIKQSSSMYAVLKTLAEDTTQMNSIGTATLNEDTNAPGRTAAASQSGSYDEYGRVDTTSEAIQPADKAREFQFNQGEQITNIIEKIVLQSRFCIENSTKGARDGLNKWFRIETQVYLDENALTDNTMGRRPKVYVFSVIEYEVPENITMSGNQRAENLQGLKKSAAKEYNYIYTGKNEDVLAFDINFNNAYMMSAHADLGMTPAPARDVDVKKTATDNTPSGAGFTAGDAETMDDAAGGSQLVNSSAVHTATSSDDIRIRIAEMFHDKITTMNVDMVSAEMEIMGDPYFIPQESGNYVAALKAPNMTVDGTMPYQQGPVFVNVNFRTPFDYQVSGATMELPQIVTGFSGLFQVISVINRFASGKFTQNIKMIRMKGQDDEATSSKNKMFIQPNDADGPAPKTVTSDGTVGNQRPGIDCMPPGSYDNISTDELTPAIDEFEIEKLAEEMKAIATAKLESMINDKMSKGFAKIVPDGLAVADLSKVIPGIIQGAIQDAAFGAIASKVGGVGGLAIGSLASDAIGGIGAAAAGGYGQTSLQAGLAAGQKATDAVTASLAANEKIASVSGAAKSKVSSLLGGT